VTLFTSKSNGFDIFFFSFKRIGLYKLYTYLKILKIYKKCPLITKK